MRSTSITLAISFWKASAWSSSAWLDRLDGVGRRAIERIESTAFAAYGKHLVSTGKCLGDVQQVARVVLQVELGDGFENVIGPEQETRNGKGAVVRRAQHDQPVRLCSSGRDGAGCSCG